MENLHKEWSCPIIRSKDAFYMHQLGYARRFVRRDSDILILIKKDIRYFDLVINPSQEMINLYNLLSI